MLRKFRKRIKRALLPPEIPVRTSLAQRRFGLPPGSIVNLCDKEPGHTRVTLIKYSEHVYEELQVDDILSAIENLNPKTVTWVNVEGFKEVSQIEKLGETLNIDKLVLEDILDHETRPKFEEYDHYSFTVMKMLYTDKETGVIFHEQVSFILSGNLLISFQMEYGDVFDKVRERLRKASGRIRNRKADYLMYALMDVAVDNYFVVLDAYDERVRNLEDQILDNPEQHIIADIRQLRKDNIILRKASSPLREVLNTMLKSETRSFESSTKKYLRELQEHVIQTNEAIEMARELSTGLMEIYLSALNTQMGNVNKALTVIATIFLPLTFITGIYGMNFQILPGADYPLGFWIIMAFMFLLFIGMLIYFRLKKWF